MTLSKTTPHAGGARRIPGSMLHMGVVSVGKGQSLVTTTGAGGEKLSYR